jgi:hypothetical protein
MEYKQCLYSKALLCDWLVLMLQGQLHESLAGYLTTYAN